MKNNLYIYAFLSAILLSWCSLSDLSHQANKIINSDGTSCATGEIWYTWEAYSGLVNEIWLNSWDTNFAANLTGSMSGLAKTNNSWLYMSPLYPAIDWCNRESRYARLFEANISMLVMNCKLEDGLYTINYTDDNTWTEDKYIWSQRVPQNNIMQVFFRENTNNFDKLSSAMPNYNKAFDIPKWCIWKKISETQNHEEWEIVTDDSHTMSAESKLQEDNSYMPCGDYWYTMIWRKRFTIFKSRPQLVFWSNVNYEYPLFDINTIKIE